MTITTEEDGQTTVMPAVQNIKDDIEYDKVAPVCPQDHIRRVSEYDLISRGFEEKHRQGFIRYIKNGIATSRLNPKLRETLSREIADALVLRVTNYFCIRELTV